jgi:hypothetical protein
MGVITFGNPEDESFNEGERAFSWISLNDDSSSSKVGRATFTNLPNANLHSGHARAQSERLAELLNQQIERSNEIEKEAQRKFKELVDLFTPLKDKVITLEKTIDESRAKSTEILAVFVGLFTFVSIGFQVFKEVTEWNSAAGLLLMCGGVLVCFIALTDLVISAEYTRYKVGRLAFLYLNAFACIFFGWKFFQTALTEPKFFPKPPNQIQQNSSDVLSSASNPALPPSSQATSSTP